MKGRTINTNCFNTSGKSVSVSVMFEYGVFSDYITPSDLQTLTNHVNILRTDRIKVLSDLKNSANSAAGEYSFSLDTVTNLSKTTDTVDASVAKMKVEKEAFDTEVKNQGDILTRLQQTITDLNAQIKTANDEKVAAETIKANSVTKIDDTSKIVADLSEKLAAANNERAGFENAKVLAIKNSDLKVVEIKNLNASKVAAQNEREVLKTKAVASSNDAKNKFLSATAGLKTLCDSCSRDIKEAETNFVALPYRQDAVVASIRKVYTTGG